MVLMIIPARGNHFGMQGTPPPQPPDPQAGVEKNLLSITLKQ